MSSARRSHHDVKLRGIDDSLQVLSSLSFGVTTSKLATPALPPSKPPPPLQQPPPPPPPAPPPAPAPQQPLASLPPPEQPPDPLPPPKPQARRGSKGRRPGPAPSRVPVDFKVTHAYSTHDLPPSLTPPQPPLSPSSPPAPPGGLADPAAAAAAAVPADDDDTTRLRAATEALQRLDAALAMADLEASPPPPPGCLLEGAASSSPPPPPPPPLLPDVASTRKEAQSLWEGRVVAARRALDTAEAEAATLPGDAQRVRQALRGARAAQTATCARATEAGAALRARLETLRGEARADEGVARVAARAHAQEAARLRGEVRAKEAEAEALANRLLALRNGGGLEEDGDDDDGDGDGEDDEGRRRKDAAALAAARAGEPPPARVVDGAAARAPLLEYGTAASRVLLPPPPPPPPPGQRVGGQCVWEVLQGVVEVRGYERRYWTAEEVARCVRDAAAVLRLGNGRRRESGGGGAAVAWEVVVPLFAYTRVWYAPVLYVRAVAAAAAGEEEGVGEEEQGWVLSNELEAAAAGPGRALEVEGLTVHGGGGGSSGGCSAAATVLRYDALPAVSAGGGGGGGVGYADSVLWLPEPKYCGVPPPPPPTTQEGASSASSSWLTRQRPSSAALEAVYAQGADATLLAAATGGGGGDAASAAASQLLCEPLLDPEVEDFLRDCRRAPNPLARCAALAARAEEMLAADLPRPLVPQAQVSVALHASGDGEEQPPVGGGGGGGGGGAHSVVLLAPSPHDGAKPTQYTLKGVGESVLVDTPGLAITPHTALGFSEVASAAEAVAAAREEGGGGGGVVFVRGASAAALREFAAAVPASAGVVHGVLAEPAMTPAETVGSTHAVRLAGLLSASCRVGLGEGGAAAAAAAAARAAAAGAAGRCGYVGGGGGVPAPLYVHVSLACEGGGGAEEDPVFAAQRELEGFFGVGEGVLCEEAVVQVVRVEGTFSNSGGGGGGNGGSSLLLSAFWAGSPGVRVVAAPPRAPCAIGADAAFARDALGAVPGRDVRGVFVLSTRPLGGGGGGGVEWVDTLPRMCPVLALCCTAASSSSSSSGKTKKDDDDSGGGGGGGGGGGVCRVVFFSEERHPRRVSWRPLRFAVHLVDRQRVVASTPPGADAVVPYSLVRRSAAAGGAAQLLRVPLAPATDGEGVAAAGGAHAVLAVRCLPEGTGGGSCSAAAAAAAAEGAGGGLLPAGSARGAGVTVPAELLRLVVAAAQGGTAVAAMTPGELAEALALQILHAGTRRSYLVALSGKGKVVAELVQAPRMTKDGREILEADGSGGSGGGGGGGADACAHCGASEGGLPYMYYAECSTQRRFLCSPCAFACHVYRVRRYACPSPHQYGDVVCEAAAARAEARAPLLEDLRPGGAAVPYTAADAEERDVARMRFVNTAGVVYDFGRGRAKRGGDEKSGGRCGGRQGKTRYRVDMGAWTFPLVRAFHGLLLAAVAALPQVAGAASSTALFARHTPSWSHRYHPGKLLTAAHGPLSARRPETPTGVLVRVFAPGGGGGGEDDGCTGAVLRGRDVTAFSRFGRCPELLFPTGAVFVVARDGDGGEDGGGCVTLREVSQAAAEGLAVRRLLLSARTRREAAALFAVAQAVASSDAPRELSLDDRSGGGAPLGDAGAEAVAACLEAGVRLAAVSMAGQGVTEAGALRLLDALRCPQRAAAAAACRFDLSDSGGGNRRTLDAKAALKLRALYNAEAAAAAAAAADEARVLPPEPPMVSFSVVEEFGEDWPALAALAFRDLEVVRFDMEGCGDYDGDGGVAAWEAVKEAFRRQGAVSVPGRGGEGEEDGDGGEDWGGDGGHRSEDEDG